MKKEILIVEDDLISAWSLKDMLIKHDFTVVGIVDNANDAIEKTKLLEPDLILMDIALKGQKDGCYASSEIRKSSKTLIIFLTAHGCEEVLDCTHSFIPDDYLRKLESLDKPYNETQIITTIKFVFERQNQFNEKCKHRKTDDNIIHLKHGYIYHKKEHRLVKNGCEVELGSQADKLVELLCQNINTSVSPQQICNYIYEDDCKPKALKSLISRIREKTNKDFIKNINGRGYKVEAQFLYC